MVREFFAPVPNKSVTVPRLDQPLPPFDDECLRQLLRFVPVKDKDVLSLLWPSLPYSQPEYRSQPLKYLQHLFGHEGKNSLLSYLKQEGLALELSSYSDHDLWAISSFYVDITLTKKGLVEYERVISSVFKYAQVVRDSGIQEYVFEECRRVGELEF